MCPSGWGQSWWIHTGQQDLLDQEKGYEGKYWMKPQITFKFSLSSSLNMQGWRIWLSVLPKNRHKAGKINMAGRCIINSWSSVAKCILRPSVVEHTCSSGTQTLKAGGLWAGGRPGLHGETLISKIKMEKFGELAGSKIKIRKSIVSPFIPTLSP